MEKRKAFGAYIASLLLFGTNGVVAAFITGLESAQIVMFRILLGSAILMAAFLLTGSRFTLLRDRRRAALLMLSGASMGVSWMFQYEAYREIGVGTTSLIYCCGPALLLGVSPLVFGERTSANRIAGFALVLLGSFFLSVEGLGAGCSAWGYACGFMTAVAYVCMVVFNKKASSVGGLENPTVQLGVAFLTVAAFVVLRGDLPGSFVQSDVVPLLVLGLVNTGFGCLLYFGSLGGIEGQTVAICDYLEPASAILFATALLGEAIGYAEMLGMVAIAAGVLVGYKRRGTVTSDPVARSELGSRPSIGAVRRFRLVLLQGVPTELAYREGIEAGVLSAHWALHILDEGGVTFDWFGRLSESDETDGYVFLHEPIYLLQCRLRRFVPIIVIDTESFLGSKYILFFLLSITGHYSQK